MIYNLIPDLTLNHSCFCVQMVSTFTSAAYIQMHFRLNLSWEGAVSSGSIALAI